MTQSELSHMASAVDYSTINIVLGISISIIISKIISMVHRKQQVIECPGLIKQKRFQPAFKLSVAVVLYS